MGGGWTGWEDLKNPQTIRGEDLGMGVRLRREGRGGGRGQLGGCTGAGSSWSPFQPSFLQRRGGLGRRTRPLT